MIFIEHVTLYRFNMLEIRGDLSASGFLKFVYLIDIISKCRNSCIRISLLVYVGSQTRRVAGVEKSMEAHVRGCENMTSDEKNKVLVTLGRKGVSNSEPSANLGGTQAKSLLVPIESTPMDPALLKHFQRYIVQTTLSANLPLSWVDDPFVHLAFQCLRSGVVLPDRNKH